VTTTKAINDCKAAVESLERAQTHLAYVAAMADYKSAFINKHLPNLMAANKALITAIEFFYGGL
jgi:hypothetical protein